MKTGVAAGVAIATGRAARNNVVTVTSSIKNSSYARRLANDLSEQAQKDADHLVAELKKGNLNAGIGPRRLEKGFSSCGAGTESRVIVKKTGDNSYDIAGKFQGHKKGDSANSDTIRKLMDDYEK